MGRASISTTVTELPESRVRVVAEVAPDEVQRAVERAARQLGRNLRVAGFRKGKVPPPIVIQRLGRAAVVDKAVQDGLKRWWRTALDDAGIASVGQPKLDVTRRARPTARRWTFSIEIGVRPRRRARRVQGPGGRPPRARARARRGGGRAADAAREPRPPEPVQRPARAGDLLVIDFEGLIDGEPFDGGRGRDQMVELGSGMLIAGFEEQLEGATAGETRTVAHRLPRRRLAEGPSRRGRGRQPRDASRSRSRRCSPRRCPSSTTRWRSRPPASTRSRSCARTSPPSCWRPTRAASRRSSPRRCSTRSRPRPTIELPERARRRPRPRDLGEHAAHAGLRRRLQGRLPADLGQDRGAGARRAAPAGGPRAAPRGRRRRDRRGRGRSSSATRSCARPSRRPDPDEGPAAAAEPGRAAARSCCASACWTLLAREAVAISIEDAQARGKPWPLDHEQVEPELPAARAPAAEPTRPVPPSRAARRAALLAPAGGRRLRAAGLGRLLRRRAPAAGVQRLLEVLDAGVDLALGLLQLGEHAR